MTSWVADALCAQTDPDAFVAVDRGRLEYREARKVCAVCPVRVECLRFAVETREPDGMYGGLSPAERRKLWKVAP